MMEKAILLKKNLEKVTIGPSGLSLQSKNTIDPEKKLNHMVLTRLDYSYYQIVLLKKIYNGQKLVTSAYKFIQKFWMMVEIF